MSAISRTCMGVFHVSFCSFVFGSVMVLGSGQTLLSDCVMSEARRRKCRVEIRAGIGGKGCRVVVRKVVR